MVNDGSRKGDREKQKEIDRDRLKPLEPQKPFALTAQEIEHLDRADRVLGPLGRDARDEFWRVSKTLWPPTPRNGPDNDLVVAWEALLTEMEELVSRMKAETLTADEREALARSVTDLINRRRELNRQAFDRQVARLSPEEQKRIAEALADEPRESREVDRVSQPTNLFITGEYER